MNDHLDVIDQALATFDERRIARLREAHGPAGYPRRNPIASDLHPCRRYMVLSILAWDQKPAPDARGMAIMEEGRFQERRVLAQLREEGWPLVEDQGHVQLVGKVNGQRAVVCTGRRDAKVALPGTKRRPPLEVKSTSEWRFGSIETEADLHKDQWFEKWWRQMQLYCLGDGEEDGLLVVSDCRGGRKILRVKLDLIEAENLLRLCETALEDVELVRASSLQEPLDTMLSAFDVPYYPDFSLCRTCDFRDRVCFPKEPRTAEGIPIRAWLAEPIARHQELKDGAAEYRKLDDQLQKESRGNPLVIAGEWLLEGRERGNGWTKTIRHAAAVEEKINV